MLLATQSENESSVQRLTDGLVKLRQTSDDVGKLRADLEVTLVDVEAKKEEADEIATVVNAEKANVEEKAAASEAEAADADVIAKEAGEIEEQVTCFPTSSAFSASDSLTVFASLSSPHLWAVRAGPGQGRAGREEGRGRPGQRDQEGPR
jgi:hypothetical protein